MTSNVTRRVFLIVGIYLAALGLSWLLWWSHPLAGTVLTVIGVALTGTMRVRRTRAGL
jgi:hypothetical protein